jgi:hypothetical protein
MNSRKSVLLKTLVVAISIAAVGWGCSSSPVFQPALLCTNTPVFARTDTRTSLVTTFDYNYTVRRQSGKQDWVETGWKTNESYNLFRLHETGFFQLKSYEMYLGGFLFSGSHDLDCNNYDIVSMKRNFFAYGGEIRGTDYFLSKDKLKIGMGYYAAVCRESGSYEDIINSDNNSFFGSVFPVFKFYTGGQSHFFVDAPIIEVGGLGLAMNAGYCTPSLLVWIGLGAGLYSSTEDENFTVSTGLSYSIPLSHKFDTTNNTAKTNSE